MDVVVWFGCALVAGGLAWAHPWPVIAVAACAVAAARRRAVVLVVIAIALGVGFSRARGVIDAAEARRAATVGAVGRCFAHGVVVSSPVSARGVVRWDAELVAVDCDGAAPPVRACLYGGPSDLARGDEVEVVAQLGALDRWRDPELGDPRPREARAGVLRSGGAIDVRVVRRGRGPLAWVDRARAHTRARIEATFAADVAPLARALVLGETDVDADDDAAFRASGLSHLLAVSGTHLVVAVLSVVGALRAVLARVPRLARAWDVGRAAAAIGIPLTWAYASFAGASGSGVRAAWMLTAALGARAIGRAPGGARALGLSLACGALVDPLAGYDVSFLLSAVATAGLLALARPWSAAMEARVPRWARGTATTVAATCAASIACAPVLATMTPALPLGGIVANVIAVPIGELAALPLCLAHAALSWWPAAERGCAAAGGGALAVVRAIARATAAQSWAIVTVPAPTAAQLAAVAAAVAVIAARRDHGAPPSRAFFDAPARVLGVAAAALVALEAWAIRAGAPRGALRVTFLDVAQGDAAIVDLPDGRAALIDGGGTVGSPVDVGARVIAPVLRARRRDALAAVILSHPHPDHFGGLATGLDGVRVGEAWDTGQGEREGVGGGYAAWLAHMKMQNTPILRPGSVCGARAIGGATFEVLAPCPEASPDRAPNDNSLVVRVRFGRRAVLFVGDAEHEEEGALIAARAAWLRADVLKVGHHGSRTSTSRALLDAVRPSHAVISCGARNRFGHPAGATLDALAAAGVRALRTDRDGAIAAWTDGEALEVGPAR